TGFDRYVRFDDLKIGDRVHTVGNAGCKGLSYSSGFIIEKWSRKSSNENAQLIEDTLKYLEETSPIGGRSREDYFEMVVCSPFIEGGNSGGPVCDDYGRLVGIVYAGGGSLSLIIPVDVALKWTIPKLVTTPVQSALAKSPAARSPRFDESDSAA